MNIREWLAKSGIKLKFKTPILELDWEPKDEDKQAAWELYIELLTRITTQPLPDDSGDELSALSSVHKLFKLTRDVLKRSGRNCIQFTRIAVAVLNQRIRPFTAKWHKLSLENAFKNKEHCKQFRKELAVMQNELILYSKMLADMAGVEDITVLE
ncbi:MAG: hypothetical protein KAJ46_00185 [Sedimentisphaerales bacterium]|nr:hypothetical protein [Sedimentisphaerales bacterium]